MPMLRACTGTRPISWLSICTLPWSSVTNPAMARSSVVLPLPLGPSSPNSSPSANRMLTPPRATTAPYFLTASVTTTSLIPASPLAAEAVEARRQQQDAHRDDDDDGGNGVDFRREALAD